MADTQSGEESSSVTPTVKPPTESEDLFDDPESVRRREQVLGVVRLVAAGIDFGKR